MKKLFVLVASAFLIALMPFILPTEAQDTDPEPTPLPSKTATSIPTDQPESTPTADVTPVAIAIEEPFIQADLSILSGNVQRPNGLFWHNGMVYASCNGDWTIYEIEANTGSTVTYLWGIRNAHTLHAEDDVNGELNLWVPDFQTNELVRVFQRSTEVIASDLEGPWGITPDNDEFLITNLLGNSVVRATRDGEIIPLIEGLRSPAGIVKDGDYVYIANNGSASRALQWIHVDDLNNDDAVQAEEDGAINSLVSGLQNTTGVIMGPDGNLYFAYSLGTRGVIGRVNPELCRENGGCTNDQVEIVVYTDLAAPLAGLAMSPDMRLYTHTIFSPDIYYIDLNVQSRQ
jgi:hypothetical protein